MSKPVIITLDGPAGVGKSTAAQYLAGALGLPYLNTGAMFRALALRLGEEADQARTREDILAGLTFDLSGSGAETQLLVNGRPTGAELRTEQVGRLASSLAQDPQIRTALREMQRNLARRCSLVAEGRDLGTVVFPDAPVKFFLDASPAIRAERRWRELAQRGEKGSLAEIEAAIRKRDEQDRMRPIAPLKPASDAILIDTSALSIEQVTRRLEEETRARLSERMD